MRNKGIPGAGVLEAGAGAVGTALSRPGRLGMRALDEVQDANEPPPFAAGGYFSR